MAIISDNWSDLLEPGLKSIFEKHMKQMKDYIPELFSVETSSKAAEHVLGVGSIGEMDEWNGSVSYEDFNKGYKKTFTHIKYSKGIQIERELVEDDQYAEIRKRVKMLSRSVYFTRQNHAASVFNNAFSGGYVGADSVALCSASHPNSPSDSSVQSNAGSTALSADAVDATSVLMQAWKDDKGNLLNVLPDTLLVPPALGKTARIIAETDEEPFTTDHGINIYKGALNVIILPFLSDANNWFMLDSSRARECLMWFDRRKAEFANETDFNTEMARYKAITRFSYGWADWSFCYGHAVS